MVEPDEAAGANRPIVTSIFGAAYFFFLPFPLVLVVVAILMARDYLTDTNADPTYPLAFVLLLSIFGWLFLTWMTLRATIYPDYLVRQSVWGKRVLYWKDLQSIEIAPGGYGNFFNLSFIILFRTDPPTRSPVLMLHPFGNRTELMQAILQRAWEANREVFIDLTLTDKYGQPPFPTQRRRQ